MTDWDAEKLTEIIAGGKERCEFHPESYRSKFHHHYKHKGDLTIIMDCNGLPFHAMKRDAYRAFTDKITTTERSRFEIWENVGLLPKGNPVRIENLVNQPYNALAFENLRDSHRWFPDTPNRGKEFEILHYGLGVAGECGEVVEIIKKWHGGRPGYDMLGKDPEILGRLAEEICDTLMYLGDLAAILELDIDAAMSLKRLANDKRFKS